MNGSFGSAFKADLLDLMRWRRDVRRFRTDPVEAAVLDRCLATFNLAPSVGLSEPWRIIKVESNAVRAAAQANFETANAQALQGFCGERARLYSALKLSGMREAPVQLAVFCDRGSAKGHGLGAATMPETLAYSVVGAITLFWLTLRAEGLGLGWVSILDPKAMARDLAAPGEWDLIGYLCIGWPEKSDMVPELEQVGWEKRAQTLTLETR